MESIQKLVILGLLKEGPKHGYKIKNEINKIRNIFASWDNKSIYYPLRMMEKDGLLAKSTGRSGKRPEKYVYKLTPEGEKEFQRLLDKSFLSIHRPTFDIDVALLFLPYIKPKQIKRSLNLRERILQRIEKNMKKMIDSPQKKLNTHHLAIIQHNLDLIRTEIKFLTRLSGSIKY
ncbi:MAG: PadR family transcriptional regulator [Candidatus Omnitrophota bacterium]